MKNQLQEGFGTYFAPDVLSISFDIPSRLSKVRMLV